MLISLFGRRVIISQAAGSLQVDGHSLPVSVGWRCPFGERDDNVTGNAKQKESFAHVLYEGTGREQPGKSFLLMQRFYTRLQRVAEYHCHLILQYEGIQPEQFLMSFEQYRRFLNGTWMTSKKSERSPGIF